MLEWGNFFHGPPHRTEEQRIVDVLACPDNSRIARVPNAGEVIAHDQQRTAQVMHNGILTSLWEGGFDGLFGRDMLRRNRGVHEPQEYVAFQEVLPYMPEGAAMMELGSYWAFYSMWFYKEVKAARCYLIEPSICSFSLGAINFNINKMQGNFFQGIIGNDITQGCEGAIPVTVDGLMAGYALDYLHILHADIQEKEYEMLLGAQQHLKAGKIGYIFISTHSNELHGKCYNFLRELGFSIVVSVDLFQSYSLDGLLVAKSDTIAGPGSIKVSIRESWT